jgi:hypothetical protein
MWYYNPIFSIIMQSRRVRRVRRGGGIQTGRFSHMFSGGSRRVRRVRRGGGMETGRFSDKFPGGSRRSRRVRRGGGLFATSRD